MKRLTAILTLLAAVACSPAPEGEAVGTQKPGEADVRMIAEPLTSPTAVAGSDSPRLSRQGDSVILSWLEREEPGARWFYAELPGGSPDRATEWGVPCRLTPESAMSAAKGDPPLVARIGESAVAAVWPAKPGSSGAMDLYLGHWRDGVRMAEMRLHDDDSPVEHAFASGSSDAEGRLDLIWLDGRDSLDNDLTALTHRAWSGQGLQPEHILDSNVCACCSTAISRSTFSDGEERLAVAYRDRTEQEIRDISLTVRRRGVWAEPITVHRDGWHIAGCPVNGPALDDTETGWVVAWFTAADSRPKVSVAFADDESPFDAPIVIDDGSPAGQTGVVSFGAGRALAVWVRASERGPELVGRIVNRAGSVGGVRSWGRIYGKPSMVRESDGAALLTWAAVGNDGRSEIRVERIRPAD